MLPFPLSATPRRFGRRRVKKVQKVTVVSSTATTPPLEVRSSAEHVKNVTGRFYIMCGAVVNVLFRYIIIFSFATPS